MKFVSFKKDGQVHTGVVLENGVADLYTAGMRCPLKKVIACADKAFKYLPQLIEKAEILPFEGLDFAPATNPDKIVCVGLNYRSHAMETGAAIPETPVIFCKFNDALAASGDEITLPPWLKKYDYEAELVIVIGREAWHVGEAEAGDYIFGYTCGNDISAREAQKSSSQWLIGKTLPGFAPCGPVVVTADSFSPEDGHAVICRRNGVEVQHGSTDDLIFDCKKIVSYVSSFIPLAPGDLIFTGTPSGVQLGKSEAEADWLKPGEEVCVSIEGIGELYNKMV